jgi:nickel-type superoxide dismutase maturation protease
MFGLITVQVAGPSMEPALRSGDWWIVRTVGRHRVGDVAVIRHPQRESLLIVKRLTRQVGELWWVEGDNSGASDDSRTFGAVPDDQVVGVLILRYRRASG